MFFFNYLEGGFSKSGPLARYMRSPTPPFRSVVPSLLRKILISPPQATGRHTFLMAPKHMS